MKDKIDKAVHSVTAGVVNYFGDNGQANTNTGSGQLAAGQGDHATASINNGPAVPLPELVAQIKAAFAADASFDADSREAIDAELERIETQLPKPAPNKGMIQRSVETLQELAKGGTAAHTIGGLLLQAYDQIGPFVQAAMGM